MGLFRPTVIRSTPAGPRRSKSSVWWGSYRDARTGKRNRVSLHTADRQAAELALAEVVRRSYQDKADLINLYEEHHARPLLLHLGDWRESLLAAGRTRAHADLSYSRAKRIVKANKLCRWPDLAASPGCVETSLAAMHTNGLSARTVNHYMRAIKSFAQWMVRDRRAPNNPIAHLGRLNECVDRRIVRRAFTTDEFEILLQTTRDRPSAFGLTGDERAVLYLLARETGFRANELRSLTPASFDLDAKPPIVTVAAGYSKRRREDTLPLRRDVADLLYAFLQGRKRDRLLFAGSYRQLTRRTATMLHHDLRSARAWWITEVRIRQERRKRRESDFLAIVDGSGRILDFHALRHTFIESIVHSGVAPKDAQSLARHSSITLTYDLYTRPRVVEDLGQILESIPGSTRAQNRKIVRVGA